MCIRFSLTIAFDTYILIYYDFCMYIYIVLICSFLIVVNVNVRCSVVLRTILPPGFEQASNGDEFVKMDDYRED